MTIGSQDVHSVTLRPAPRREVWLGGLALVFGVVGIFLFGVTSLAAIVLGIRLWRRANFSSAFGMGPVSTVFGGIGLAWGVLFDLMVYEDAANHGESVVAEIWVWRSASVAIAVAAWGVTRWLPARDTKQA